MEDEDNDNLSRRRNFLRQRALPILSEGFPDCGTLLAAAAPRFAEDADLLADLAHWDEKKAAANGEGSHLSIGKMSVWRVSATGYAPLCLSGGQAGRVVM